MKIVIGFVAFATLPPEGRLKGAIEHVDHCYTKGEMYDGGLIETDLLMKHISDGVFGETVNVRFELVDGHDGGGHNQVKYLKMLVEANKADTQKLLGSFLTRAHH